MSCGLFWEFWNYWAVAKWTYDLPFLGHLEKYSYFEMSWIGMLGFLPFGLECWAALNTIIALMQKFASQIVEPPPNEYTVI